MYDRNHVHPGARILAAVLSGLLATSAIAPYVSAQSQTASAPSDADKAAARSHYEAGKAKLDAKDYAGALKEFQSANALIPTPQALEKIALCYDGMNDVPNALKAFELFIEKAKDSERLAPELMSARERVEALRVAPVPVSIKSDPSSAQIEVDGQPQSDVTPVTLKLTPGVHRVKVTASGYDPVEKDIDVKAGEDGQKMSFSLMPTEGAAAPVEPAPQLTAPPASTKGTGGSGNLPAYITLDVAGASAIVGTIFGVIALGNKSDFNDNPTTSKADDAERNALIADMAFGVAVTLGVTGTVLLLTSKSSSPDKTAMDASTKKSMQFAPFVSPTAAGAAASWRF